MTEIQVNIEEQFRVFVMDTGYGTELTSFIINKREEGYTWDEFQNLLNEVAATENKLFDPSNKAARYKSKDRKDTFELLPGTQIPQKDAYIVMAPTKMDSGSEASYWELIDAIKNRRSELGTKDPFNPVGKTRQQLKDYLEVLNQIEKGPENNMHYLGSLESLAEDLGDSVYTYFSALGYKVDEVQKNLMTLLEEHAKDMENQASELSTKARTLRGQIIKITTDEKREAEEYFNSLR